MNGKGRQLYIGGLARLVGVSVKTVRHYHKIGLMPEPERTGSGYRLYTAEHVRRLRIIREMREIGLSFAQIGLVMGRSDDETRLRETLQDVLDKVDEQIHELHERRERIFQLLAQPTLNDDDLKQAPALYLEQAYQKIGHLMPDLDQELLDQEVRLEAVLSRYNWGDNLPAFFANVIAYFQAHPQQYKEFISDLQAIWGKLQSPETEDATLRALAGSLVEKHRPLFDQWLAMSRDTQMQPGSQHVLRDMFGEVVGDTQRRFGSYLVDAYRGSNHDRDDS